MLTSLVDNVAKSKRVAQLVANASRNRTELLARRAVAAGTAQDDVVPGDRVARLPFDSAQRALELVIGEGLDLAASLADEMVMVFAVRVERLEAGDAGADVDPLDEPVAHELIERAVDRRDPNRAALLAEAVEELLCGQAAILAPEQLDHGPACASVAVAPRSQ